VNRANLQFVFLLFLGALVPPQARSRAEEPAKGVPSAVNFNRDILPVLSDNCFRCHGPDPKARKARLRLDTREEVLRTREPIIVPGNSSQSELVRRITSKEENEVMPPPKSNKKLTPGQIALLKQWIDQGAKWGKHWAFESLLQPRLPRVLDARWPKNPIDNFVLARLEREGLRPSPEAPRTTLIRRVSLDLTGMPPTLADVDAFVEDRSDNAYEKVVDRLLTSPHYGERMAWDWLEAARYADSNGYQGDGERTMWPWRDWVIAALNRDLPFDQFTTWQLAGDLCPSATTEQKLATGFCRNHMINGEGGRIADENRVDYVMDMAETTGTVWLGMTFNCCRCHDHKFDPLTQREYYSLFAFFNQTPVTGDGGNSQTKPVVELPSKAETAKLEELTRKAASAAKAVADAESKLFPRPPGKQVSEAPNVASLKPEILAVLKTPAEKRTGNQIGQLEGHWEPTQPAYVAQLKNLHAALDARDRFQRSIPRVMVMEDMPKPRDTFVLVKGIYNKPTDKVTATVPACLTPFPSDAPRNRLGLARWLVATENPLTARVTVNRCWQQFFGTGLVKTPEDFGVQGERPSHPELLDWLASEFIHSGWNVKALHKRIVMSATYRQSSRTTPALTERDPHNRLLARGPRFRMPSWMIRDQALAASGLLVEKIGGPPVKPYQPAGIWEEATFGQKRYEQDKGDALYRRSIYTFWRRIVGPTMLFDSAPRQTCIVKPTRTNTPLQALTTLNDVGYVEAARALAQRVLQTADPRPEPRVDLAFRLVLARSPAADERQVLLESVSRLRREFGANVEDAKKLLRTGESKCDETLDPVEHAAYTALCSAILNIDEALTKE